jgi:hypothetical protein
MSVEITKNDAAISTFPLLTSEEQQLILDKKLEDRFSLSLLTDDSNPNYIANREVAISLCKGDFKSLSTLNNDKTRVLSQGFRYWADNFVWIQNPRAESAHEKNIPFLLWDYQERAAEEIIRAITLGYDMPIEKSRDMGLSWLIVAIFVYMWHFQGFDFLLGSGKAEYVDTRGSIKSLFEKARYIIERSPKWMIPKLIDKKHDKSMLLIHPISGASLVGESNNINFGRSDRKKAILFDEFAMWEQTDKAAWQSCASSTSCRIPLSTATTRGTNCHFFTVINNAKKKVNPYLRLHWSLHPKFAQGLYRDELGNIKSPWYDDQVKRASSLQEVYQELDIDYLASAGDKVFPMFSIEDNVKDDLEYNPNLPLYISADFGLDTTAFVWWQYDRSTGIHYIIDEYQNNGAGDGTSIYHFIDIIQNKPYKAGIMYGDPHSGENKSLTSGQSNASILRKYGFIFKSQRMPIQTRIATTRNMMDKIIVSGKCTITIEALSVWQFVKQKTGNTSSQTPKHDEYSHISDAVTYYCGNITFKKVGNEKRRIRKDYSLSSGGVLI